MRPTGKEAMMNKATGEEPKSGHRAPAPATGVGNETKADMRGAQEGQPTDKMPIGPGSTHLKGAVDELRAQHPISYHDHGPHHGTDHHIRHSPHVVPNAGHPHHKK